MRNDKKICLLGCLVLILPLSSFGQSGDFGLGVIVGDPTGVSFKLWTGASRAVDGAAAWSFGEDKALQFHVDQLFHVYGLFRVRRGRMPFYYGLGVRVLTHKKPENSTVIGARFPLGMEYIFGSVPLGIFLEIVPILDLTPGTDFDFNAAAGVRFYF